jgi:sterol 24-C-methyltransferase
MVSGIKFILTISINNASQPLEPSFSLKGFRTTKLGIYCTSLFVYTLERIGLAPKGVTQAHSILMTAHNGLVRGGKSGIFTPMYYFLVRKPAK